ncbi:hypothetical protein, partial [Microvirga sp. KLBC 81]|uniref:hypothetical protein n=1 Tax=Microvirga sp. KLBC 81 TaxID=1862707 RepID=UPI00197C4AF7
DELPNDAGHLVAVEFDDRIGNLDLRHDLTLRFLRNWNRPAGGRRLPGAIARLWPVGKVGGGPEFSAFSRYADFSLPRCRA